MQTVYLEQKYGRTPDERRRNKKILWKSEGNVTDEEVDINLTDLDHPFVVEFDHGTFLGFGSISASLRNITFVGCGKLKLKTQNWLCKFCVVLM